MIIDRDIEVNCLLAIGCISRCKQRRGLGRAADVCLIDYTERIRVQNRQLSIFRIALIDDCGFVIILLMARAVHLLSCNIHAAVVYHRRCG